MLALDPAIDEYNSTRQVFDQIAMLVMLVATVIGLLVLWDTAGLGVCVGNALKKSARQRRTGIQQAENHMAGETWSLLSTFRGLAGSATAREPPSNNLGASSTARSAPGAMPGVFGMWSAKGQVAAGAGPASHEWDAAKDAREYHLAGSAAAAPTFAQRVGFSSMSSPREDDRQGAARWMLPGLGLEVAWKPTPLLFFCLGFLSQLPLMIALCCYTFFATLYAGAGADGLSYFPVILSVAQLLAAASVSTVLREWDWMLKAVVGLLISVPAVLVLPVCSPGFSLFVRRFS
jgi:hypothetical protein